MFRTTLFPLLLAGVLSLWVRWYYVCRVHPRPCCQTTTSAPIATGTTQLLDHNKVILSGLPDPQFENTPSGLRLLPGSERAFDEIAAYMKKAPDARLMITGFTHSDDAAGISGIYETVGAARAAVCRDRLAKSGVEANRLFVRDETDDNRLVAFDVITETETISNGAETQSFDNISFRDLTFASGSANFKTTPAFDLYVDSLKRYILELPDKKIFITGHTDDQGNNTSNTKLGQQRAEAVKSYLNAQGLRATIEATSQGEDAPVADNSTEAGRKRNRRVNIRID
jgi:OOP family OmpA-OmpF porin